MEERERERVMPLLPSEPVTLRVTFSALIGLIMFDPFWHENLHAKVKDKLYQVSYEVSHVKVSEVQEVAPNHPSRSLRLQFGIHTTMPIW